MKATLTDIRKRIVLKENKTEGIVNYDIDNAYPNRIIDIVQNSGTASLCVSLKRKFIFGGGFKDKDFYKSVINRDGHTVDQLLRKVVDDKSVFGFAIHVNYNMNYEIIEANFVPFKNCRLTTFDDKENPNMVAIYDNWDKSKHSRINKDEIKYINFFNPENVQKEVEEAGGWDNYKGQIFYYSRLGKEYQLADFDSVLEDMQTDAESKLFKFRNITTNFMASHILVTRPIEGEEDEEGITSEDFKEKLEEFQGGENTSKILHVESDNPNDELNLKKIEIQDVDKLYEYTETSCRDNIIRQFQIPPILLVREGGSLGTSKEIEDATSYYNSIAYYDQLILEESFKKIFSIFYPVINKTNDYSIIPLESPVKSNKVTVEYFPYATKNEIRESIGLDTVQEVVANTKPLYESLGVGGLQALKDILVDVNISNQQKNNMLTTIFKLTKEEADKLAPVINA